MVDYLENLLADPRLPELLARSSALHAHLCPRQVLGARMGLLAGELLGLELPQTGKRLLALVETDGCFADGVSVATGCWLGRRTLRLLDYGRVAATFVDTKTGAAVRVAPRPELRAEVRARRRPGQRRWDAYMEAYQGLPADQVLRAERVQLPFALEELLGTPRQRAVCACCGEEVVNGREVEVLGQPVCRACLGLEPYQPAGRVETAAPSSEPGSFPARLPAPPRTRAAGEEPGGRG